MDSLDKSSNSIYNLQLERNEVLEAKYDDITFPSLVVRIKALFIDLVIVLVIFTTTALVIDTLGEIHSFVKGFILIFMLYLYDPILTSLSGSTLGHKAMNLKVRRYRDPERKISLGQALLRFFVKGSLGWISFLTVTGNSRKRAIHDLASGSIMLADK
jgi:uncharacterized RDD family membrane protein YckC